MASEQLAALYEKYCDGTLTPSESGELKRLLETPAGRAQFKELAIDASLLNEILRATAKPSKRRQTAAQRPSVRHVKKVSGHWRWISVAAAALLLIAAGAFLFPGKREPAIASLTQAQGISITRNGATLTAAPGMELRRNDEIRSNADGSATARFADGSEIVIASETQVVVAPETARALVRAGRVDAKVTSQAQGKAFVLRTPQSNVTVLGTEFRVQVGHEFSRIVVEKGSVKVDTEDQKEGIVLKPAEYAITQVKGAISQGKAAPADKVLFDFENREATRWNHFTGKRKGAPAKTGAGRDSSGSLELRYDSSPEDGSGAAIVFAETQDWSGYDGISFWVLGQNTGNTISLEIFDNLGKGAFDAWERFIYDFTDNSSGWRKVTVSWDQFKRRTYQSGKPPQDGLTLVKMHGISWIALNKGVLLIDDIMLVRMR